MTVLFHEPVVHAGAHSSQGVVVAILVGLAAAGYVALAHRQRRSRRGWSAWRTVSFLAGAGVLLAALIPALAPLPKGSFAGHMYQHLLIGMYAPLGLMLGTPLTLVLRSVPIRVGYLIGRGLRSTPVRLASHPITALMLNVGGLYVLYLTPLFVTTTERPFLHHLVHAHFLIAGYLFVYSIAGHDPVSHRMSVPGRLVILGIAIAAHAVLAQLLYAGLFTHIPSASADRRLGADLMYYGGDIAELLVAVAMVTTWRPNRARARPRRFGRGRMAMTAIDPHR